MRRENWTRNELILAFNLYCKLPFGKLHSGTPQIIALGTLINRSANAVAMKLNNFASLDPYHQDRGIHGLSNVGQLDREIWAEFNQSWEPLAIESELLLAELNGRSIEETLEQTQTDDNGDHFQITEKEQVVMVRLGQRFFRASVLANYGERCCICGLPIKSLLIASHIIPWRDRSDLRVNPRNGLCLCAIHDKAFDLGLLTVAPNWLIIIGSAIAQYMPNDVLAATFSSYHGKKIILPYKFLPEPLFLEHHNQNIFLGG